MNENESSNTEKDIQESKEEPVQVSGVTHLT